MNDDTGPDILGVCEVENRFVLDALVEELANRLPARRFGVVHADAERDFRGIDTAFIYDTKNFSVRKREISSHFVMRRTDTRDITQVTFVSKAKNELVALANHWPSRTSGVETQGFRATAGEILAYWHERVREVKGTDVAIITMGDFNDDPSTALWYSMLWRHESEVTYNAPDQPNTTTSPRTNCNLWLKPPTVVIE